MPRKYAEDTKVPVGRSRAEIEQLLGRYGAEAFAFAAQAKLATILFEVNQRRVRFVLPLSDEAVESRRAREDRRRWRALLLCIKARLESVTSGIETFESAFFSHVVMPNGRTVFEEAQGLVAAAYETGKMQPLLPDYSNAP